MPEQALRPGVAGGVYPERRDARESWFDRTFQAVRGRVPRSRGAERARLEAFAREVGEQGAGLADASHPQLRARVESLRARLVVDGPTDELLAPAFALIREMSRRTLGMPHYDVQVMGGWVMASGRLAEMETGEGKTLTATLPACAAALAGIPVHVISVNDYLVERDAAAMRPLYQAFGLSVGTVTEAKRDTDERRAGYACDVTYCTAKMVAFDYLRDGLERGRASALPLRLEQMHSASAAADRLLLRGLCFAVVDEADSVLIDEARTPLILSGGGGAPEQRRTYRTALRLARSLEEEDHFRVDRRAGRVALTERGRVELEELAKPLSGFWTGPRRREEWLLRALHALHLLRCDRDYIVRDGKVVMVDQPTGRTSPDRSWERGLHQLLEVKEGCEVTPERETLARISYQQFFRRYLRLSGMTGTAREVAPELRSVYGLESVVVPTRRPVQRRDGGTRVFRDRTSKWRAVVTRAGELHREGRPVLVGTCSVEDSEHLSGLLTETGLPHQVLNARQDAGEARVVATAGEPGRITVATNMAGRGTDIGLAPGVAERGGLHVIATQLAEAGRIDRQLYGRSARQGEPGGYETLLSLEDEPVAHYWSGALLRLLAGPGDGEVYTGLGRLLTSVPQRAEERRHARMRRGLVHLEEVLGDLLAFSGPAE